MKTLINRIYHICSSEKMFHENIKELKTILSKNMFPPKLIDQTIKRYLNDKDNKEVIVEAEKIIIATGSVPVSLPGVDIDEKIIVSSKIY